MIERATENDIKAIVDLKLTMFEESGHADLLANNCSALIFNYYEELYKSDDVQHFIIKEDCKILACAGGFIKSDIPYCFMKTPFYGFIGDVYTLPNQRNKGYASLLTNAVIKWLKGKGVTEIRLLASTQAKHLYEEIGFCSTDEMVLFIK